MAPWLIFGAGGSGVGAKTLALALAEQRPVIAVVRNAQVAAGLQEKGVQVFIGDACDSGHRLCLSRSGQHATVISSMGGAQDYLAHRTVIDEAEKAQIKRMILVTSLGCGDSWPFCPHAPWPHLVRRYAKNRWLKAGYKPVNWTTPFSAPAVC